MTPADLATLITDTKALITKLSANILALTDMTVRNYSLDTGQGVQTARRQELDQMIAARRQLIDECAMLEARRTGSNVQHVRFLW